MNQFDFDSDLQPCIAELKKGGLILYPTDTVWGIGCDATNADAVASIYALKKRKDEKAMIVLLADEKDIPLYVSQPDPRIFDYVKGVGRPTTVIYEGARGLSSNIINSDGSIGIRINNDPFCNRLIRLFGKPIVSTSANISGYPPPSNFEDIDIAIKNGVDYIVQHRRNDMSSAVPSTVVKWNADGSVSIIRP